MSLASDPTCRLEVESQRASPTSTCSKQEDKEDEKATISVHLSGDHSPCSSDSEKGTTELDDGDIPDGGLTAWLTVFGGYVVITMLTIIR